MRDKIAILFPTQSEAQDFTNPDPQRIEIVISGVGLCETGAMVARVAAEDAPRMMILAGIAGAYPDSGLMVGDVVVVSSETASDQGAFRDGVFQSLYAKIYVCEYASQQQSLKVVHGSSVNAAAAQFFYPTRCGIESMEGAAFFATALALGVPFLEVRAVSNMTTSTRGEWRFEEATKALAKALKQLIDEIDA